MADGLELVEGNVGQIDAFMTDRYVAIRIGDHRDLLVASLDGDLVFEKQEYDLVVSQGQIGRDLR